MKTILFIVFLSFFSVMAFGEKEETKSVEEKKPMAEEAEPAEEKKPMAEEAKPAEEKKPVAEEAKPAEEKKPIAEEAKPAEEKKPMAEETEPAAPPAPVEEKVEETTAQETADSTESDIPVQAGVSYECDGGRSYTLHEPGVNSESHLCELDAGHTETPADWYALHQSSFCREKLQEIVSHYNCSVKE